MASLQVLDAHALRRTAAFTCALSPTSPVLATAGSDGAVLLWDLRSLGRGPLADVRGHSQAVHGLCFATAGALGAAPDAGEMLVTGSSDGTVRVTETRTASGAQSACLATLSLDAPVMCTAFSGRSASPGSERVGVGVGSGRDATDNVLCILSTLSTEAAVASAGAKSKATDSAEKAAEAKVAAAAELAKAAKAADEPAKWAEAAVGSKAPEVAEAPKVAEAVAKVAVAAKAAEASKAAEEAAKMAAEAADTPTAPARNLHAPLLAWLADNGQAELAPLFASQGIDRMSDLALLTRDDLKELGLPIGPRNRLLAALARQGAAPTTSASIVPETMVEMETDVDGAAQALGDVLCLECE